MAFIRYEALVVTATSSGSITTLSTGTFNGFVQAVRYVPTNATSSQGISSGGGGALAITAAVSGLAVLSLANASSASEADYYPRALLSDTGGTSTSVGALIPLHNERFQVVMTSGSTTQDTKSATLHFYVS